MREFEEKLEKEKAEMKAQAEAEREAIANQATMAAEEKERLLEELK